MIKVEKTADNFTKFVDTNINDIKPISTQISQPNIPGSLNSKHFREILHYIVNTKKQGNELLQTLKHRGIIGDVVDGIDVSNDDINPSQDATFNGWVL